MRFPTYIIASLVALAIVASTPGLSLAQENQPAQVQSSPANAPLPQLQGGVGTVIRVDQPDNCLRIRSGPGNSYDVIGCAPMGAELNLTGAWSSNEWAQLAGKGWVYGPQIQTDLRPPQTAFSSPETYVVVEEGYPVYDVGYLPDYGYSTYWYAGIPIIVYAANIWWRHHPWWSKKWVHSHRAWNWSRNFQNNRRIVTPTARGYTPRTRGFNAANAANFSRNVVTPNRSSANINALRSGAVGAARSARTYRSPSAYRTGNYGAR
ncbi:MAG: hypothetical protein ACLQPD_24480 [Desulfomonilaceae bacterium]